MSCRLITKRKKESPPPSSTVVERQARISRTRSKLPSQPTRASQHGDAGGRSATLSLIAWLRRVHGPAFFSLTPARRPHECTASPTPGENTRDSNGSVGASFEVRNEVRPGASPQVCFEEPMLSYNSWDCPLKIGGVKEGTPWPQIRKPRIYKRPRVTVELVHGPPCR